MFLGWLLVGSIVGAAAGLTAFLLGSPVWMAVLIYSGVGVFGALAGALAIVLQPKADHTSETAREHDTFGARR